MKKSFALAAALGCFLSTSLIYADGASVLGKWRSVNEKGEETSTVEIYEQGGKVFGKLASLKDPNDAAGKPVVCSKCEGADKGKPILGLVIIRNLTKDGDEYTGGTILDPTDGKSYSCKIEAIEGGKKLKVRGFLGISLLGRTQIWLKQ